MLLYVPKLESKKERFPTLGGQLIHWMHDNLVHGPGDLRGMKLELDEEKQILLGRMYEVYPKDHPQAGRRRFKRAGIMLQKGTAKTELAACIAAAELHPDAPVRTVDWDGDQPLGGGVVDPYIPMVAYTEEQSDELAYGTLKCILEESPIAEDFDIGLERILRKRGDGKAVSLSTSPNARDGARTSFSIMDETHWFTRHSLKKAHQVMMANLPKRKGADPWALEVTTAPEPGLGSVAEQTLDYARAVHEGRTQDSRLLFYYRYASDKHDLDTEEGARAAVIEAAGPTAAWRDIDSIVSMWNDPSTDRQYWRRVWLNQLVQAEAQAFDAEQFRALGRNYQPEDDDLITLGFDGAQFRDAVGLVATHVETGYQWLAGLWECPPDKEDWQVPAEEVDQTVDAMFERFDVWRMYCDPPYWQSWVSAWAGRYGDKVVIEWWTNRNKQMAQALEGYVTAIRDGSLSHDGNPDLIRHIANARRHQLPQRDEENNPLWVIRKDRSDSPRKIDAAMAAVLSWEARNDALAAGVLEDVESGIEVW